MIRNLVIKSENRKENTIVLLIDFKGHPLLGDEYVNNTRYSEIQRFLTSKNISREHLIFISNHKSYEGTSYDPKLTELFNMAKTVGYTTRYIDELASRTDIIDTVQIAMGWDVTPRDTQIIIGGCNFGGCVINAKKMSAVHWVGKDFQTIIHLPLCAEYEQPGVTSTEKAYNGFKQLYDFIKEHNAFDIKLTDKFEQLEMTFYEKK